MNSNHHIVMLKMTAIVLDEKSGKHTVYVDELPSFTYSFTTTPELDGFTVQYRKSGDSVWTTDMPTEPGTYDVKITRPMDYKSGQLSDPDHLPFEQVIRDGLTIKLRTIEYTSPEPQTLVYDGEPHNLRVTVTSPADATVTYTSDTGAPIGYPAFTDAGDYTANYTLSRTNYNPETGTLRLRAGGHPQGEEALSRLCCFSPKRLKQARSVVGVKGRSPLQGSGAAPLSRFGRQPKTLLKNVVSEQAAKQPTIETGWIRPA